MPSRPIDAYMYLVDLAVSVVGERAGFKETKRLDVRSIPFAVYFL